MLSIDDLEIFLDELYSIEQHYSVEGYFYEALFVFEDNLASLARFYAYLLTGLSGSMQASHICALQTSQKGRPMIRCCGRF